MNLDEGVIVTAVYYSLLEKLDTCVFQDVEALVAKKCGELSNFLSNPDQLAIARHVWGALGKVRAPPCRTDKQ